MPQTRYALIWLPLWGCVTGWSGPPEGISAECPLDLEATGIADAAWLDWEPGSGPASAVELDSVSHGETAPVGQLVDAECVPYWLHELEVRAGFDGRSYRFEGISTVGVPDVTVVDEEGVPLRFFEYSGVDTSVHDSLCEPRRALRAVLRVSKPDGESTETGSLSVVCATDGDLDVGTAGESVLVRW